MADSKPLTAITITTATPKIREFVPKGEWREEGLGHYDPLSIWNVNENNEGEFSQQSARHNLSFSCQLSTLGWLMSSSS